MNKFILIASILYVSVWAKAELPYKELLASSRSGIQKVYYIDDSVRGTISYSYCLIKSEGEHCQVIGQELSRDLFYNYMKKNEVGNKVLNYIGLGIGGAMIGAVAGVGGWIGLGLIGVVRVVGVPEIPAILGAIAGLGVGGYKAHNEAKIDDLIKQLNSKDTITIDDNEFSEFTELLSKLLLSFDYYQ